MIVKKLIGSDSTHREFSEIHEIPTTTLYNWKDKYLKHKTLEDQKRKLEMEHEKIILKFIEAKNPKKMTVFIFLILNLRKVHQEESFDQEIIN